MSTRDDGLAAFREMMPGLLSAEGDVSMRNDGFAGELGEFALRHVFADLWTRPELDRRSRSLVTLGALIALGATDELRMHFAIALRNGLTRAELDEVVYHMTAYAGFPAASAAKKIGTSILDRPTDTA